MEKIRGVIFLIALNCLVRISFASDSIKWIHPNIGISKLSERIYLVKSYEDGKVSRSVDADHLLIVDKTDIVLVNTPWTNSNTSILLDWVKNEFKRPVSKVIITHSHIDCAGGIDALKGLGIATYCSDLTRKLLPEQTVISVVFHDSLSIKLQDISMEVIFPGAGHTKDNVVVWVPEEHVLYGGCLVKALSTVNKGNIADADLIAWPTSIKFVQKRFNNAKIVVPGHFEYGDISLLSHTLELLERK